MYVKNIVGGTNRPLEHVQNIGNQADLRAEACILPNNTAKTEVQSTSISTEWCHRS
jgi:hypothetical protein